MFWLSLFVHFFFFFSVSANAFCMIAEKTKNPFRVGLLITGLWYDQVGFFIFYEDGQSGS